MTDLFEYLREKEYVGRFIFFGMTPDESKRVAIYGITGRSTPSRERKLIEDAEGTIRTVESHPGAIKSGNPKLLLYPAIKRAPKNHLMVSNGAQTDMLAERLAPYCEAQPGRFRHLGGLLAEAFREPYMLEGIDLTQPEPDSNRTARISGIFAPYNCAAGLHITRVTAEGKVDGLAKILPLSHFGTFVSTYSGRNVPENERIPPFEGDFAVLELTLNDPHEITERVYDALGPKHGAGILSPGQDFRVSVATVYCYCTDGNLEFGHVIKNRVES